MDDLCKNMDPVLAKIMGIKLEPREPSSSAAVQRTAWSPPSTHGLSNSEPVFKVKSPKPRDLEDRVRDLEVTVREQSELIDSLRKNLRA